MFHSIFVNNPSNCLQIGSKDVFAFLFLSGDKSIDENEFCNVCRYHGIAEAEAREAFKKLGVVSAKFETDSKTLPAYENR